MRGEVRNPALRRRVNFFFAVVGGCGSVAVIAGIVKGAATSFGKRTCGLNALASARGDSGDRGEALMGLGL